MFEIFSSVSEMLVNDTGFQYITGSMVVMGGFICFDVFSDSQKI